MIAINVADIVEDNGKTIRENNLEKVHDIPIGTLVEVKFDRWYGEGACEKIHARLWVVSHYRDCDGTPLYSLSHYRDCDGTPLYSLSRFKEPMFNEVHSGFDRESLIPVEINQALKDGEGSLCWNEN